LRPDTSLKRWGFAAAGSAMILGLVLLIFLTGSWIAKANSRAACLDDGGVWVKEAAQCRFDLERS
jgi:hypothetical protein